MATIDQVMAVNQVYADARWLAGLTIQPRRGLTIVTCMDTRLDPHITLGLNAGDAHILRNAGGIVTEDVLRSLIVSHHLGKIQEVMIINHTDCGLMQVDEAQMAAMLRDRSGKDAAKPGKFYAFTDLQQNVRSQIWKVRLHPWLPDELLVRGFVYDVKTARLTEVDPGIPPQ